MQGAMSIESGSARCEFGGVGIEQISLRLSTGADMMRSAFALGVLDLGIVKEGRFVVKLGTHVAHIFRIRIFCLCPASQHVGLWHSDLVEVPVGCRPL